MKTLGSGWGNLKAAAKINSLNGLVVGQLILNHSNQFNAKNVIKITEVDTRRGLAKGIFVNPANSEQRRQFDDREFALWDFEIESGLYFKVS